MTSYILAVSIGPVQDFIAAARKTRDLWYGSYLLSEVARRVASSLPNAELVFPHPSATQPTADVPIANKIMAIVTPPTGQTMADVAETIGQDATDYLLERWDEVETILGNLDQAIDTALAQTQLHQFLEFYTAWVPYDSQRYSACRKAVDALLASRKALRDFAPAVGKEMRPKSSLDPSRESVVRHDSDKLTLQNVQALRDTYYLKRGEQLDGISLVKRLAPAKRFVSISRVTIDPFIRRIEQERRERADIDELWQKIQTACGLPNQAQPATTATGRGTTSINAYDLIKSGELEPFKATGSLVHYAAFPFDTQLFYDDNARDIDATVLDEQQKLRSQKAAKEFYTLVERIRQTLHIGELPSYFATLVADGDKMGKTIAELDSKEQHQQLSDALIRFADKAAQILADHNGALVYSGGDDVLAFLPLDTAIACADALQSSFKSILVDALGKQSEATLSVGLSIAHYSEHIQDLLDWGRKAEKMAKGPRNALAVVLHTRTAGETSIPVVLRWDESPTPLKRWNRWIGWHRDGTIPDGAAYDLRELARELRGLQLDQSSLDAILPGEVKRILKRKQRRANSTADQHFNELVSEIGSTIDRLDQVVNALIIARQFKLVFDVAAGSRSAHGGMDNG